MTEPDPLMNPIVTEKKTYEIRVNGFIILETELKMNKFYWN